MTNNKRINIRSIVLAISLAIIAIAITIIIINGIGIQILKAKAPANQNTLQVAALRLNKLYLKDLKLDQKSLVGKDLKVGNDLSLVGASVALELKNNKLLAKGLNKYDKQLLVSELQNSKSLLLNGLTRDQRQLDLDSLQSLLKLQANLSKLG